MITLACGKGLCSSNCPTHKGGVYIFPTHTQNKNKKEQLKLKTPKIYIDKAKRREKKKTSKKK